MEGANLTWANLKGTRLEKATGLKDIQGARNWFLAFYDTAFIKENLQGITGDDHNDRVIKKDLSFYEFAGKYIFEGDFSGFTLIKTGFQRAYLPRVKFPRANLQGANLSHASLKSANFRQAELSGAVLDGANIRDADFCGAQGLTKAQVLQAMNWALAKYDDNLREDLGLPAGHNKRLDGKNKDLSGPGYNFDGKHLCNQLNQSDFSEVNFAGAKFFRAALKKTDFSKANLERVDLMEANCQMANLEGVILREARLIRTNFKEANLREVNLSGADLSKADLTGACLGKAILQGAKLYDAILEKTDLKGADLSKVQGLSPKQLKTAIIDASTKLP